MDADGTPQHLQLFLLTHSLTHHLTSVRLQASELQVLRGHTDRVYGVDMRIAGGKPNVVSCGADHTLRVWSSRKMSQQQEAFNRLGS